MTTTAVPVATRASGFTSYDPAFEAVTGRDPVLAKVLDVEAHEGPVYLAGRGRPLLHHPAAAAT